MKKFLYFFVLWIFVISTAHVEALKINLFASSNGKGLEHDQKILATALRELGHEVKCLGHFSEFSVSHVDELDSDPYADVNIFFQGIREVWTPYAKQNWFVPNPEWFYGNTAQLELMDLILCRTKEVQRIFQDLHPKTYFLGFTSTDCYDPSIEKNFLAFFHLAGGSPSKGTKAVLKVWQRNPSFPLLIGIKHGSPFAGSNNIHWINTRVSDDHLRYLQNVCGFHLCPSETEGFGHYIMEAMSAGAVVITTDAPPMNEFIKDPRCLVHYDRWHPLQLGMNYYVSSNHLELVVNFLKSLPREELLEIGAQNRLNYLKKTEEFKQYLSELMVQTSIYLEGE